MKARSLFLSSLIAALSALAPSASAQLVDRISEIAGDSGFESDAQTRYFNRDHCGIEDSSGGGGAGGMGGSAGVGGSAGMGGIGGSSAALASQKGSPDTTDFEIRLDNTGGAIREVYLWVGAEGAQCNLFANRNETQGICAEVAGNPRVVGQDFLVSGLLLQDLISARAGTNRIVTCESSGLTGTPYEIFAFRDEAFSGVDVPAEQYGVAAFRVDLVAPDPPNVNTTPQRQTNFQINWSNPDPPDLIQLWNFYSSDSSDPSTATELGITASLDKLSQTISASALGLENEGDMAYVFMTGIDQAFVSNALQQANESELSEPVEVTFTAVEGVCSGDACGGCAAAPMSLGSEDGPSHVLWVLGLLFVAASVWRLRR